jgi:acyl-CoA thioester hydrolase
MGFVYHANYLVWMDMARTEHLRGAGMSYRALEEQGLFLAVTEAGIRYRQPARYDDLIRVRCWVRELASRRVTFGYAIERDPTDALLATAQTALSALDRDHALARIPARVRDLLAISPDPVRV